MDGTKYKVILEGKLFQTARSLRLGWRCTLKKDNGPKHTAKPTLEWHKGKHFNNFELPSQSPDINPVENLWHDLKIAVHQYNKSTLK